MTPSANQPQARTFDDAFDDVGSVEPSSQRENDISAWLAMYVERGFSLVFWPRDFSDPKNDWKGPREDGWPTRVYTLADYREGMQVGVKTGVEMAPAKFLGDVDLDWSDGIRYASRFLSPTNFYFGRKSKQVSHLFYTTSTAVVTKKFTDVDTDKTTLVEFRGTKADGSIGLQTMSPPSIHRTSGETVTLQQTGEITHDDTVPHRVTLYAVACLLGRHWPRNGPQTNQHDTAAYVAGFLLRRGVAPEWVPIIVEVAATLGGDDNVRDRVTYARDTVEKFKAGDTKLAGGPKLAKELGEPVVARLREWLSTASATNGPVTLEDFYAYMPKHEYIFIPTREFWPVSSVNARIFPIPNGTNDKGDEVFIAPNVWLDRNRPIEQMTWAPGQPLLIRDRLVSDGGWIERPGLACFNLYRPPQIVLGDPRAAGPWLELVRYVYPDDAKYGHHFIKWCAQRVQQPGVKINHGVVLGGSPGIGKDTILEPVKTAVGPWNFAEVSPKQMMETRFNGYAKSVILRISEVRDLGDVTRYDFYEHMKPYTAAPPDVLRVDEKHLKEHGVFNVCAPAYTTNHQSDGMFLPADDRRHYVLWSPITSANFEAGYWERLYAWYESGGRNHVAAYLMSYDLSKFDPKAPPPKTEAFWHIVDANRSTEDAELADVLDVCGNPQAVTLWMLIDNCLGVAPSLATWLDDRKNSRAIPHRMKAAEYVPHRNEGAKDGLWKIKGRRQVVYVKQELTLKDREAAVQVLVVSEVSGKGVARGGLLGQ